MSTEEPTPAAPEAAPTPPPNAAAEPAPAPPSGTPDGPSQKFLLIVGVVVVAVLLLAFGLSQLNGFTASQPAGDNYTVQSYKPDTQLISASDHVIAYQKPDTNSPAVMMFGQGLALNVTGRVSRGIANDWYAIDLNGTTAFIRQQDAAAGTPVAPPITAPRVAPLPPREDTTTMTDEEGDTDTEAPPPQSGPPDLTGVRWMHRPTRRDFQNAYPRRALFAGQNGHVTLSCTANSAGGLNCSVTNESPGGYGFGRAALDLSRKFRLEPATPDGRSVAGGQVDLPIEFRSGD
ncbi:MAG: energy transducer TonB [Terricaulis sp.]